MTGRAEGPRLERRPESSGDRALRARDPLRRTDRQVSLEQLNIESALSFTWIGMSWGVRARSAVTTSAVVGHGVDGRSLVPIASRSSMTAGSVCASANPSPARNSRLSCTLISVSSFSNSVSSRGSLPARRRREQGVHCRVKPFSRGGPVSNSQLGFAGGKVRASRTRDDGAGDPPSASQSGAPM